MSNKKDRGIGGNEPTNSRNNAWICARIQSPKFLIDRESVQANTPQSSSRLSRVYCSVPAHHQILRRQGILAILLYLSHEVIIRELINVPVYRFALIPECEIRRVDLSLHVDLGYAAEVPRYQRDLRYVVLRAHTVIPQIETCLMSSGCSSSSLCFVIAPPLRPPIRWRANYRSRRWA